MIAAARQRRSAVRRGLALDAAVSLFSSPAVGNRAGGDWCEAVPLMDDRIALTIGDVAGHGDGVALSMASVRATVVHAISAFGVPSEVLAFANEGLADRSKELIVTAIVAILDRKRGTLTFASAGHPPPLMLTRERNTFLKLGPADTPLGVVPRHRSSNYVVALPDDALFVLYSDGLTENDRDSTRGEAELVRIARLLYDRREPNLAGTIARYVLGGGRGRDDVAAIAVRHTSPPSYDRTTA